MIHSILTAFQQFHKCIPLAVAREAQWHIELTTAETEDTDNHLICHIMNLLRLLSDKGSRLRFCWIPSHCGIEGNTKSWLVNKGVPWPCRGGCYRPASNWSYKDHRVPYLVPRTTDYLPPLWTDVDHWPHPFEECSFTGNSGWLQISQFTFLNFSLSRFPRLAYRFFTRCRILLSDTNNQIFHATHHLNPFTIDAMLNLNKPP